MPPHLARLWPATRGRVALLGHAARDLGPQVSPGWIVLAGLALFFGLACAFLPPWLIVAALMVPAVGGVMAVRPEYGLTALVALVCGLIHPAFVPRVPMLGGSVAASDAVLLMLALYAGWLLATRADSQAAHPPRVPGGRWLTAALVLFAIAFALSVVNALWVRGVNPTWVLGEARRLLYLTALPIAVLILSSAERQRRFVRSLVVLGCLFAVGQVLQGLFNLQVFGEKGRMVALETMGRQDHGTTRSLTLGIEVIVYALLLVVGGYVVGRVGRLAFLALASLLAIGILLSFGRTTFVVVLVCLIVMVAWLNAARLPQLFGWLVLALALGSAGAIAWKPQSFAAVYYRMTSIDTEVLSGDSAQWRVWEAEEMLPHLRRHPFGGVGLGAEYKGASRLSADADLNRYVHNGYLYMGGKMGPPALLFFLAAIAALVAIGRRSAKSGAPPWNRVVGASGAAMMINFLLASVTEPHFMVDYSLVLIAVVGALVYLSAARIGPAPPPGAA